VKINTYVNDYPLCIFITSSFSYILLFLITRGVGKTDKAAVAKIEDRIFPVIQLILMTDVTEFLPYVFQVLSLTLETRQDGVKGPYMELFPLLLQPVLWERQGML